MLKKSYVILLLSSSLLACAATDTGDDGAQLADKSRRSNCISEGTIRDYRVLNDSNLIVTASGRRKYHIVLSRRAFGLNSSWAIGFASPTSQICPDFGDVVADGNFGPEKFGISSITPLSADDEDALLIRFGKKKPEFEQTPAPEDVEGAEVEELD